MRPAEQDAPSRIVIERVRPEIDGGRFPIKRTVDETVEVLADIHAEGHDLLAAVVRTRREGDEDWIEEPMRLLGNDCWRAEFVVTRLGTTFYSIRAWVARFATWRRDLSKRAAAGQDLGVELQIGAALVEAAARRAPQGPEAQALAERAAALRSDRLDATERARLALEQDLADLMARHEERASVAEHPVELRVTVDPERARFGAWYEMFPRSASPDPGRHGTLRDVQARLPYIAGMGFDVLYLPPIHPIGRTHRKGPNNTTDPAANDPGSPWAIGSKEGGHKAVHPELGTLEDFRSLVTEARRRGIEVAMDLAFQCSPDHPYVREHPEWFVRRPDGTIQYAENPPKRYQDIYPMNFETPAWRSLWAELKSVVEHWIERAGVRLFRVDNPHTKPFAFWEWLIEEVKRRHPETIFLSEAFTRPKVMARLAKIGFTQSYTYFAWRNSKPELVEYLTELTRTELREVLRPNLWPNTPDILTEYLQTGGRPAFVARLVLAATLSPSYGIYGPPFELCVSAAREPGSEEYLDSEKYEARSWDLDRPDGLRELIARVNRIRRAHPALQHNHALEFHPVDNDRILAYSKRPPRGRGAAVLTVVNLGPHRAQSGWIELPLEALGIDPSNPYQVHDLVTDARYLWWGARNFVRLDPAGAPAHIFAIRRKLRTEHDFDYFF